MKGANLDLYWVDKDVHLSCTRCIDTTKMFREGSRSISRAYDLCAFQVEPHDGFNSLGRKLYEPPSGKVLQSHVFGVGYLPSAVAEGAYVQSVVDDRIKHIERSFGLATPMHLDAEAGLSGLGLNDRKFRVVCFVASLYDDADGQVERTRLILASQFVALLNGKLNSRVIPLTGCKEPTSDNFVHGKRVCIDSGSPKAQTKKTLL